MERKLFYKKLAAFALPLIAFLLTICSVSPTIEFKYQYLKNDCSVQPRWLYKRMYVDADKVDLAFFGTSHTLQAINDSLLTSVKDDFYSANFGYCRFGRDIQYELFRQLLSVKKPKTAVFEIAETEPSYSHPAYTVLGEGSDIFIPSFIYNQDFYKNRCEAFLLRLSYLRSKYYGLKDSVSLAGLHHFGLVTQDKHVDPAFLESEKEAKLKDLRNYDALSLNRKAELSFSTYYLTKIKELGEKNNCKIYFLYLPAYGNEAKNSLDSAFYKRYFETLIPPDSILNNTSNWQDAAHLNEEGSTRLSNWISKRIKLN